MARISPVGSVSNVFHPVTSITGIRKDAPEQEVRSGQVQESEKVQPETTEKVQPESAERVRPETADKAQTEDDKVSTSRIRMMDENQMQMLYRQGKISYDEMSKESDRRDRIEEMAEAAAEKIAGNRKADEEQSEEKAAEIAATEVKDDKGDRTEDKTEDKAATADDQKKIVREQSSNFGRRMGEINEKMQNFNLVSRAQEIAEENDRTKLMSDIIMTQIVDPAHK